MMARKEKSRVVLHQEMGYVHKTCPMFTLLSQARLVAFLLAL